MNPRTGPFAPGHVAAGIYPEVTSARAMVTALATQARAAVASGFDGVTLAEHHGGYAGYTPNPVLTASLLLPHMSDGWCAAAPTLATLRHPGPLAEDVAWTAAAFPRRFAVAFGVGFAAVDFDVAGARFSSRVSDFRDRTTAISMVLHGAVDRSPLSEDPAVGEASRDPFPILIATRGPQLVEHAARIGAGLLLPPLPQRTARSLTDGYRDAGGHGPVAMTRWVWLGAHPADSEAALNEGIATTEGDLSWRDEDSVIRIDSSRDPTELAGWLAALAAGSGATTVNLRFRLPGMTTDAVTDQIQAIGSEVLPLLREHLRAIGEEGRLDGG